MVFIIDSGQVMAKTFWIVNVGVAATAGAILFLGLATPEMARAAIVDTAPAGNLIFNTAVAGDQVNLVNGPIASGFQTSELSSGSSSFTTYDFANKTNVTVNGQGGDTLNINNTIVASGLTSLTIAELIAAWNLTISPGTGGTFNIVNGPILSGFQTTQVNFGGGFLDVVDFANQGSVTLKGNGADVALTLNNALAAAGLNTLVFLGPTLNLTINAFDGIGPLNVVDGPIISGFQTTQLNFGGAFVPIDFTNSTHVTINGLAGDTVFENFPDPATALVSLTVNVPQTVPEPGTLLAMAVGLCLLGFRRLRLHR
jgi:hypothetical protein